ncbi:hypothetical protein SAMN05428950_101406 [Sphingomonas sp. OV641]|nr:hypothetical protein SAMN05428950_101406 [Sphingomonas sp. OV641]
MTRTLFSLVAAVTASALCLAPTLSADFSAAPLVQQLA